MTIQHSLAQKQRRRLRLHRRIRATASRPKLVLGRTNKSIYLQVIDETGRVLAATSDCALVKVGKIKKGVTKTERAKLAGAAFAQILNELGIKSLAVDRGSNKYHGRIKAAVEIIKESGVEI
jgi:large subunit ribosomal protein L18